MFLESDIVIEALKAVTNEARVKLTHRGIHHAIPFLHEIS